MYFYFNIDVVESLHYSLYEKDVCLLTRLLLRATLRLGRKSIVQHFHLLFDFETVEYDVLELTIFDLVNCNFEFFLDFEGCLMQLITLSQE